MKRVDAKQISDRIPEDLPVLRVFERSTVGHVVRLCAVGDIGLSGRARETAIRDGAGALFGEVAPLLQSVALTCGNLETPLLDGDVLGKLFAGSTSTASALYGAGITVVHLANNHIADYGGGGLASTLQAVCKAGMLPLGAGDSITAARRLLRTDVGELRIGWLGCGRSLVQQYPDSPQYWEFAEDELAAAVSAARPAVDVLIVSVHIGLMFLDYPDPAHKRMAERLMNQGADLVLMHHPHVLQGVAVDHRQRVCCYSLGNFVWDHLEGNIQSTAMREEQQQGAVLLFEIDTNGIASVTVLPTLIDEMCRVRWASGKNGERILDRLERISLALTGDYRAEFDRQRIERNLSHVARYLVFHGSRGHWSVLTDQIRRVRLEHIRQLARYTLQQFKSPFLL